MANMLIKDLRAIAQGLPEDVSKWPHIPCPTCKRKGLTLADGSLVKEESKESKSLYSEYGWEPYWIEGGFHCILQCNDHRCEIVRAVGAMNVADNPYRVNFDDSPYVELYTPSHFFPSLPLIESFDLCPKEVQKRVKIAAAVIWVDPSSAANRLRSAAEALMDDQGIMRKGLDRKGKVIDLTLHRRIELFQTAKPELKDAGDLLLAVKFIGNVGSHESVLGMHGVLDGVEIFDQALTLIYDDSNQAILNKAALITARKGVPDRLAGAPPF